MNRSVPVVCEGDDKLHSGLLSSPNNTIKDGETGRSIVDVWLPVDPVLEVNFGRSGTLTAVLGKAVGVKSVVAVIETPSAHDIKTGLLSLSQAEVGIGFIL